MRTVEIANGGRYSYELCGGTHVERTGDIGVMFIVSESSIGAGLRRVEAVTGKGAEDLVAERLHLLEQLTQKLQAPPEKLPARASAVLEELEAARRRLGELEKELARHGAQGLLDAAREADGFKLLVARTETTNADTLRETGDWLREQLGTGIVILGSVFGGRPMVIAMVSKDLATRGYDAVVIARGAGQVMGGGGGGRPEVAQAGGRDPSKLDEALSAAQAVALTGPVAGNTDVSKGPPK